MNKPGVVRVSAHVKLIGRGEFEWPLYEALQDGLCGFSHVELWRLMTGGLHMHYSSALCWWRCARQTGGMKSLPEEPPL